jgi:hypothetical protein
LRPLVVKKTIKNIAYWTLPQGLVEVAKKTYYRLLLSRFLKLCRGNSRYRDLHRGQRCFIVCNGPSVNRQNLLPLKGEIVFSVSNGYHHRDYAIYRPRYHCVPQFTYTEKLTKEVAIAWFREMQEKIGEAELFLSYRDEPLVRENHLFPGRKVNYLCMNYDFSKDSTKLFDIAKIVPGVWSVPVMVLMIAMYMGFKDIYLLGVEHDSFKTGEYKYFYKPTVLSDKAFGVTEDGKTTDPLCDELYEYYRLFSQYRALKRIASSRGINIYNATAGGALDEFERVSLEDVLKDSGSPG